MQYLKNKKNPKLNHLGLTKMRSRQFVRKRWGCQITSGVVHSILTVRYNFRIRRKSKLMVKSPIGRSWEKTCNRKQSDGAMRKLSRRRRKATEKRGRKISFRRSSRQSCWSCSEKVISFSLTLTFFLNFCSAFSSFFNYNTFSL